MIFFSFMLLIYTNILLFKQSSVPKLNPTWFYVLSFLTLLDWVYFILDFCIYVRERLSWNCFSSDGLVWSECQGWPQKASWEVSSSLPFPARLCATPMLLLPQMLSRVHRWSYLDLEFFYEMVLNYIYKTIHILCSPRVILLHYTFCKFNRQCFQIYKHKNLHNIL